MWKLAKWTVGTTGVFTSGTIDPQGFIGGTCAEFFKHNRYQVFNRTGEFTNNRKTNLCLIQLADNYRSVSLGGNIASAVGKLIKEEDKKKVLWDFGIDWAKGKIYDEGFNFLVDNGIKILLKQIKTERMQIVNSLKNSLGLNIITDYLSLSKLELSPQGNQWIEKFIEIILAFPQNVIYKHEIEVIIETLKIHEQMISLIPEAEELITAERKIIWKINEENINLYLGKWENWEKHVEANDLINSCLKKLREKLSLEQNSPLAKKIDENEYLSFLKNLGDFLLKNEEFNKELDLEIKDEMSKTISNIIENVNLKTNSDKSSNFNFDSIKITNKLKETVDHLHQQFQLNRQENYNLNVQF